MEDVRARGIRHECSGGGKSKRENCLGRGGKKLRAEETQTKSPDEKKKVE